MHNRTFLQGLAGGRGCHRADWPLPDPLALPTPRFCGRPL
jgi:hypothetical protein